MPPLRARSHSLVSSGTAPLQQRQGARKTQALSNWLLLLRSGRQKGLHDRGEGERPRWAHLRKDRSEEFCARMMQAKSETNDEAKQKVAAAASPPKRKETAGSRRCADADLVIQQKRAAHMPWIACADGEMAIEQSKPIHDHERDQVSQWLRNDGDSGPEN